MRALAGNGKEGRYAKLAKQVLAVNLGVRKGDQVVVHTWDHTLEAAGALLYAGRGLGANVMLDLTVENAHFQALRDIDPKLLKAPNALAPAVAGAQTVDILMVGPSDPARFKDVDYAKLAQVDDPELQRSIADIQRKRKVRTAFLNIGQATPARAKSYGIGYRAWDDAMLKAITVDPKALAKAAAPVMSALSRGKRVRITFADGNGCEFKLAGRNPILDDGVLRKEDVEAGDLFVHIPSGVVFCAPLEGSAEGTVSHDLPQPSRGKYVRGVKVQVKKGVAKRFWADEREDELRMILSSMPEEPKRLGYFTIGVNPAARPDFIDNQMASGVVGVHFAPNAQFGGKIRDVRYYVTGFSAKATVEVDGKAIVRKGLLVK